MILCKLLQPKRKYKSTLRNCFYLYLKVAPAFIIFFLSGYWVFYKKMFSFNKVLPNSNKNYFMIR